MYAKQRIFTIVHIWQVENLNKNCIKIIHFPLLSDIFRARNFAFAIENIEHAYNFKSHWIPPEFDLNIFSILLFQFALGIVCFNDVDRLLQLKFSCTRNSIFENLNLVEISQVKCLILSSGVQLTEHRHKRSYTWNTKCIFFFCTSNRFNNGFCSFSNGIWLLMRKPMLSQNIKVIH